MGRASGLDILFDKGKTDMRLSFRRNGDYFEFFPDDTEKASGDIKGTLLYQNERYNVKYDSVNTPLLEVRVLEIWNTPAIISGNGVSLLEF
jgi:hypothetical protein